MVTESPPEKCHYRIRLRVRFTKGLTTEDTVRTFEFRGRTVEIKSAKPDEKLSDAIWFLLGSGGFDSEQQAYHFGAQLRHALVVAALAARLGVDAGSDKATSWINEDFARSLGLLKDDERTAPNVHGLMVLLDDGKTRFPTFNIEAKVTADPDQVISAMESLTSVPDLSPVLKDALIVLNMAMMNTQPLAQIALALSGVEALGQDEKWSKQQRKLVEELATQAETASSCSPLERSEVADAMRRSLHRIGIRQGVMRVLEKLKLAHLKKEWDRIYGIRSTLFHGTERPNDGEISQLATDVITVCGSIVLTLARSEGLVLPEIADTHFPYLRP